MRSFEHERALQDAARQIVRDGLDLRGGMRAIRSEARRKSELQALWRSLPGAVNAYQDLFDDAPYRTRQERTLAAGREAAERYGAYSRVLLGAAAVGLAADNDCLEMGLYLDENEALLRKLIDHAVPHRAGEMRLGLSASDRGQRCSTIEHALSSMELRLILLRPEWQGRQLYLGGLPWPMLSVSR